MILLSSTFRRCAGGYHYFVIFAVLDVSFAVNACLNRSFFYIYYGKTATVYCGVRIMPLTARWQHPAPRRDEIRCAWHQLFQLLWRMFQLVSVMESVSADERWWREWRRRAQLQQQQCMFTAVFIHQWMCVPHKLLYCCCHVDYNISSSYHHKLARVPLSIVPYKKTLKINAECQAWHTCHTVPEFRILRINSGIT